MLSSEKKSRSSFTSCEKSGCKTKGAGSNLPKGWLQHHERVGGHTLERHVGKSDKDLIDRLHASNRIAGASSFMAKSDAEKVISKTINENRNQLNKWIRKAKRGDRLRLNYSGKEIVGRGIKRGDKRVKSLTNAKVVLQSDGKGRYYILTAFPE